MEIQKEPTSFSHDPAETLQAAIKKLEIFTKTDAAELDVQEDGKLIVASLKPLDKFIELTRYFIGSVLSPQIRKEREKKLNHLKKLLLEARDIVQSHSPLLEKLQYHPDPEKRKLVPFALQVIEQYNQVIQQDEDSSSRSNKGSFTYEIKDFLLSDEEIKNQPIEIPIRLSVKYDSHPHHPHHHLAQKTLQELSTALGSGVESKTYGTVSHLPASQMILDAFRAKAISLIQKHDVKESIAEIIQLVKQAPIHIQEETESSLVHMYQWIELAPGTKITLTGSFNRYTPDLKKMTIPVGVKDSFRLIFESVQTGFPYPAHMGWALASELIEAQPLRTEQTPLFQTMEQKRKQLAHALLHDAEAIAKAKQLAKQKKESIDLQRQSCVALHRELSIAILQSAGRQPNVEEKRILDEFYDSAMQAPSAFDVLVQTQQQLIEECIAKPVQTLFSYWLEGKMPELRLGTHQEKALAASELLAAERKQALTALQDRPKDRYLQLMEPILGQAAHQIIMQYASEKIGFAPPVLTDFERKLQICAFQQQMTFLEVMLNNPHQESDLNEAHTRYLKDIQFQINLFLNNEAVDQLDELAVQVANELEIYFNTRFYNL